MFLVLTYFPPLKKWFHCCLSVWSCTLHKQVYLLLELILLIFPCWALYAYCMCPCFKSCNHGTLQAYRGLGFLINKCKHVFALLTSNFKKWSCSGEYVLEKICWWWFKITPFVPLQLLSLLFIRIVRKLGDSVIFEWSSNSIFPKGPLPKSKQEKGR